MKGMIMFRLKFITITITTLLYFVISSSLLSCKGEEKDYKPFEARGIVTDGSKPVAGARVRIKATRFSTKTDGNGFFVIKGRIGKEVYMPTITAWKDGFYIGSSAARSGAKNVTIKLSHFADKDCVDYKWIPPDPGEIGIYSPGYGPPKDNTESHCANCHSWTSRLYDRWKDNAHATSHRNPRFLSFYNGTDLKGEKKVEPGFKLDNPNDPGICATCHAPSAALNAPFATDVSKLSNAVTNGIHCDFCHKIYAVKLEDIGKKTGILSLELRRPLPQTQLFIGPFDDCDYGSDTRSPIFTKSEYCAVCHQGNITGNIGYSTYSEWKASPYSARGIECQNCHMPPDGVTTNFAPGPRKQLDWGMFYPLGVKRDPSTIPTHITRQNEDNLLEDAATLDISTHVAGDRGKELAVKIKVTNFSAGHHLPTGHAMRNIILLVSAVDAGGKQLECLEGGKIPEWGGKGAIEDGNYFGETGKIFAKVLEDSEGKKPVPVWRADRLYEDTRIPAYATDVSQYRFRLPPELENVSKGNKSQVATRENTSSNLQIHLTAKLIYRRFFKRVIDAKGFDLPDKILASKSCDVVIKRGTAE